MSASNKSILHAIDTTGPGGAETVFLDLVEKLQLDGYKNYAIIKGSGWVEEQLKRRGVDYYIVKPYGLLSIPYYRDLLKIIRKHNTCLVHAHLLGSTLTYSIISLFARIPLVATLHGRVDVNPNERFVAIKNRLMKIGVARLIAVSQDLAAYISARKLFQQENIQVIYNGIEESRYGKCASKVLRSELGISEGTLLVGSLGNVRPAKNYEVLIEAAAILIKEGQQNLHFIVAGHQKPDLMAKLRVLIDQNGIQDSVSFIGFHDNTAEFLGQMDYFVLSSSSEGFSIATIEAMATGLPVVATRCGGPEEIIEHQKTGLLVATGDSNALAASLKSLIANPKLAAELAGAGRKHVESVFSFAAMLDAYKKKYLSLLR